MVYTKPLKRGHSFHCPYVVIQTNSNFLKAWRRNHDQINSAKGGQSIETSQDVTTESRVSGKEEERNINSIGYTSSPTKGRGSDNATRKVLNNNDGIDLGSMSSSTGSSFSSLASIKRKPTATITKKLPNPESSPQIPPRAPVLETLKRTKRELVKKKTIRGEDALGHKV